MSAGTSSNAFDLSTGGCDDDELPHRPDFFYCERPADTQRCGGRGGSRQGLGWRRRRRLGARPRQRLLHDVLSPSPPTHPPTRCSLLRPAAGVFALASCYTAMLLVGWDLAGGQQEYTMDRGWGRCARAQCCGEGRLCGGRGAAQAAGGGGVLASRERHVLLAHEPARLPRSPHRTALHCSVWVKIIAAWLCCALYTWSLVAHRVLKNRQF